MGAFFADWEIGLTAIVRPRNLEPADYIWARIHHSEGPVYFFGAGAFSRPLYRDARSLLDPAEPAGILDNDPAKWGKTVDGLTVFRPDDPAVRAAEPLVVILVCDCAAQQAMSAQCRELEYDHITTDQFLLVFWPAATPATIEENPEAVAALDIWADAASRRCYRGIVRARALRDAAQLQPGETAAEQYFVPVVPDRCYRSFVDAGAYDGDTYRAFRRRVGDAYDNYYAFEPGAETFTRLEAATRRDPRVERFAIALLDARRMVRLDASGVHATVAGEGGEVPADRLDDVLADRRVTFVKMDVEGAEPAILRGMAGTIARQRPALAVCVYHALEHLWEIPLWIKRFEPSYRLYLRRHGAAGSETVCYAVPEMTGDD